ncbi:MAG TPA: hypothetical protein VHB79_08745 [Polyangiaceae bacterium]|nr:hypothetical protein [Polyangiaceae bacterium]
MFQRTFLTGLALSLLVIQACGSGSGKHTARPEEEGGAGGEAGQAGEPAKGGTESMAGMPAGGEPPAVVPMSGAGGVPEPIAGGGGEGGSGVVIVPPVPELLFTAKAGAVGLAGTGVAAQSATNPQNSIYSTKTSSRDAVDGTNEVVVTGTSLGLDPADKLLSFTELQAEPQNPVYLFSVADGGEGAPSTRSANEWWITGANQGDVYSSDGSTTFRYTGESGDQYGYNALVATERSIGLLGEHDGLPDDLGAMLARDANQPLGELYFTVSGDSVGALDGGVASVDPMERSCTVFKSKRDGKSSVAFTCDDLGLAPGDAIDGLVVYGTTSPTKVVFSVANGAIGAVGSAVKTTSDALANVGGYLFQSAGDTTNTVLKQPLELGMRDTYADEIDGLTVIDGPKAATPVKTGTSCDITYDLFNAAQGNVLTVSGVTNIGTNVLVVLGQNATSDRAVAYDATTCVNLQAVDLPLNFIQAWNLAIAPAAGWSSKKPLSNVQYLSVAPNMDSTEANLQVFDAAGVLQKAYGLGPDFPINPELNALLHDANNDRLFIFTNGYNYYNNYNQILWQTAMPGAQTTSLSPTGKQLALPCGTNTNVRGVDALGNVYLAEPQGTGSGWDSYAVCTYSPGGELLSPPYSWDNHGNAENRGFIVGQGAHVLFYSNYNSGPSGIQRDTHPSP